MSILQLHIVGIPYRKDIAGHVSEFLGQLITNVTSKYKQNNNNAMKQLKVWSMMMLMVMAMPLIKDY